MPDKKADKVLTFDEKTGHVDAVPVDASAPTSAPPKRSYQVDDDEGYTSTILIDGHKVFIREMTKPEFAAYMEGTKAFERNIDQAQNDAAGEAHSRQELEQRSLAAAADHAALYAGLVQRHVIDWKLPKTDGSSLPCTTETKAKLPLSLQVEMGLLVVQKSQLGKDESTF